MLKFCLNTLIVIVHQLIILEDKIKYCDDIRSGWKKVVFWIVRILAWQKIFWELVLKEKLASFETSVMKREYRLIL